MIFHTFPFTLSHFYTSTLSLSQVFSAYWWPTKHHAATHFFKLYFFIIFISYYYISTKQHAAKLFLNGYLLYRLCLADLNKVREFHPFDQVHILSSIGCINVWSLRHCRLNGLPIDLSGMRSTFARAPKMKMRTWQ